MIVADSYRELWARLHELHEPWLELRLTAREDVPREQRDAAPVPVERLADRVDDALGALDEAVAVTARLVEDVPPAPAAATLLARAGACLAEATRIYWRDLAAHERQVELRAFARRCGRGWESWLTGIREGLSPLPERLEGADAALRAAWLELLVATAGGIDHGITVPGGGQAPAHESEGRRA